MAKPSAKPEPGFKVAPQEYDPAIPLDTIKPHPANYNQGSDEAVSELVEAHGFYGGVLVQRGTGYIVAGNTRWRVAQAKGAKTIPGFWVDWTDDEAEEVLVADNHSARLATVDESALVALLQRRADSERGLAGTGVSGGEFGDMLAMLGGVTVLDPPTGAHHADEDDHQRQVQGFGTRGEQGLTESVLVFTTAEHAEYARLLKAIREANPDLPQSAAHLVLHALTQLAP